MQIHNDLINYIIISKDDVSATQVAEAETSTPTGPDINSINDVSTEVDPVVEKPSSDDRDNSDQEFGVRVATAVSGA